MTLPEAFAVFDEVKPLAHPPETAVTAMENWLAVEIRCCGSPVTMSSVDGFTRIYCGVCGRSVRYMASQWIVSNWGQRGIKSAPPDLLKAAQTAHRLCEWLLLTSKLAPEEIRKVDEELVTAILNNGGAA